MSRKGNSGVSRAPGTQPEGWPVEWTCAGTTVVLFVALSQIGRFAPSLFVGQCTTLSGMCTPASCSCTPPLRRRELVTQDAQACFQCVAEFCPVVSEGDTVCSTSTCECEDPTWPRIDVQLDGEPCWQCVRPTLDFTIRVGSGDDTCLGLLSAAETTSVGASSDARRLVTTRNTTSCLALRYNGARITEKQRNASCLAWQPFGQFWAMTECDLRDEKMQFQLSAPAVEAPTVGSAYPEVYCSGDSSFEYCVEVADSLCTEEDGRCSTEQCRCEDPTWSRTELQTLNGSQCFTCLPPPTYCAVSTDTCTPEPCECADPAHVRTLVTESPEDEQVKSSSSLEQCFRCQAPPSRNSEASTLATFLLFVIIGLAGGCFVRRLRDPTATIGRAKRARGNGDEPRPWSERWAEELEDTLEAIYDLLVENPALFLRWLRPHVRQAGRLLGRGLDACDMALEPCYCAIDSAQAAIWDWVVAQHERLVVAAAWVSERCADGVRFLRGQQVEVQPLKAKHKKHKVTKEEPQAADDHVAEDTHRDTPKARADGAKTKRAKQEKDSPKTAEVSPANP